MDQRKLWISMTTIGTLAALGAAGCASGSSSPPTTTAGSRARVARAPTPQRHVRILSPHAGARTGETVTVRVAATDPILAGSREFRYALDRRRPHPAAARFTLARLSPGRHRLVVSLAGDPSGRTAVVFGVRAPAPPPKPLETAAQTAPVTTTASMPAPASTVPAARPPARVATMPTPAATIPAPAATTPTPPPPSPPAPTTTAAPKAQGIPQGHGGDGDGDNSGGPSDGDGNI